MNDHWWWIAGLLAPAVLGVLGFYLYVEKQVRLLKTQSGRIHGGFRFVAHGWSVEVQFATQQLRIQTAQGHYTHQRLDGGDEQVQQGPLTVTLPGPGLQIDIELQSAPEVQPGMQVTPSAPSPHARYAVVFRASDETTYALANKPDGRRHVLRLEEVPALVAASFQEFSMQIRRWVNRMDREVAWKLLLRQQRAEAEAAAQERAATRARKEAELPMVQNMAPAAQIALWRETAGFAGTSEMGLTADGRIDWFIDLDMGGRITLHSDHRTIHSTLVGATVTSLGGELEVAVRDDYWSEAEPALQSFRIFKGVASDVRRAWKERLQMLCDKLRNGELPPPPAP